MSVEEIAAAAIANERGGRRGMPPIKNVLELLPDNLREEVMQDAKAALEAVGLASNEIEGEDFESEAKAVTFIDADLENLFLRLAAYAKREELSTRLDVPDCCMGVNEEGEFMFTLYLCPRRYPKPS
jgi:hypothetical protein